LNVRRLTLTPLNFVPGEAATALGADDAAWLGAATDAAGADGGAAEDGDGLADELHAVRTSAGTTIAAAIDRNRDTTGGPPLDPRRRRPTY
jgi:hypothetical protein